MVEKQLVGIWLTDKYGTNRRKTYDWLKMDWYHIWFEYECWSGSDQDHHDGERTVRWVAWQSLALSFNILQILEDHHCLILLFSHVENEGELLKGLLQGLNMLRQCNKKINTLNYKTCVHNHLVLRPDMAIYHPESYDKAELWLDMAVHNCNLSIEGSGVQGQPRLLTKFQTIWAIWDKKERVDL